MCLCVHVASFFNLRVHLATLDKSRQVSCLCPPRRDKTNLRVLYVHACTHNHTLCSALAATIVGYFKKKTHTHKHRWIVTDIEKQWAKGAKHYLCLLCLMSFCAGGELWCWLLIHNKTQMDPAFPLRLLHWRAVWRRKAVRRGVGFRKATGSSVCKHGKVCVNTCVCECAQWDRIMLQCLWKSIMCAMCFLWINKGGFRSEAGRDDGGEGIGEERDGVWQKKLKESEYWKKRW